MSDIKIKPSATGSATVTLTAPATGTARTVTLPDGTGSLIADNGSGQVGIGTTTHHDATTKLTVAGRINTSNGTATGSMNYGGGAVVNMGALTNHPVNLMVNNSTKWVIDTSGNLIAEGGGGIVLGNTSYAAANELDDYEEGDWTPVVHDVSNNLATMHSLTAGKYTKIGRVVTVTGNVRTTSLNSASGGLYISGLPFNSAAGNGFHAAGSIANGENFAITASESLTMYMSANSSKLRIDIYDSSQGITIMTNSQWSSDGQIAISVTYFAA